MVILRKFLAYAKSTVRSLVLSPALVRLIAGAFFRVTRVRAKGQAHDLPGGERVLVVRLDEIGDVTLTAPLLRELRRLLPNAWISLVVKPAVRNLVERCPYVDEVLVYDWSVSRSLGPIQRHWRAVRLAYSYLWRRRFTLALVPRWDTDHYHAPFVAYLSGAQRRVGYSEHVTELKRRRDRGFDRLFSDVLDDNQLKHEVEHNLDLVRFLGGTVQTDRLELWTDDADERFAGHVLSTHDVRVDDIVIAFAPGAGAPKRMWPLARFAEIGDWLKQLGHVRILVVGGPEEQHLGQELRRQLGDIVIDMVGRATLRQTGALLKHCALYVGSDSGSMHLAAAAGLAVVEISCHPHDGSPWHLNSPHRFGPWGVPYVILQPVSATPPCTDACAMTQAHCILDIQVERVKEAIEALVALEPEITSVDLLPKTEGSTYT